MAKAKLDPKIANFVKAYYDEETDEIQIVYLRDKLNKKEQVLALIEIVKKNVREAAKEEPHNTRFGLNLDEALPPGKLFSDKSCGAALNLLIKEHRMKLVYNGEVAIRF